MASEKDVRHYLAYWFQLGKRVLSRNGREAHLPNPIMRGDRFSNEFEECWQHLKHPSSGDCYLEGTDQTVDQLLSSTWEISDCARCDMPIPASVTGMPPHSCPCSDLPTWPNTDLPQPRLPIDNRDRLDKIRSRLL